MTGQIPALESGPPRPPRASAMATSLAEVASSGSPADGREELREFFGSVNGFGRRARRRYHKIVPARIRSRRGLLVFCGVLALGLRVYQARAARPPEELPIELQAGWVTTAKGWTDREFWIGKHQVAFRTGPGSDEIEVHNVTHVDLKSVRGDTLTYDIEYAVDGGKSRWSIVHTQLPQPAITFVHQPQMKWTVQPDLHPPVR